jgi:hypothetical protein
MKIMKFKKIVYKEKYKKKYINNGNPVSKAKSKKNILSKIKNIQPPPYDIKNYQKTPIVEFTPSTLDIFLNHKIIILNRDECEKYINILHNYKDNLNNIKIN